jgi:hypothetical protein
MHPPRPPAWLVYISLVLGLLYVALSHREPVSAPAPPPPLPATEGAVLAQTTPFEVLSVTRVRRRFGGATGTAFSVGDGGVWLAAGGLAGGCPHPALLVGAGQGVAAKAQPGPTALLGVLTTPGGAPALPLAVAEPRPGALAYVAGFPHGRPGEVALRLVGRETLFLRPRGGHPAPVLVWAEIGRTETLGGALTGLAGAPVLDGEGRVVGVVVGQAPRRGRVYTTTWQAMTQALAAARVNVAPGAAGQPINRNNYGLAADDLRRSYRVTPAVCAS